MKPMSLNLSKMKKIAEDKHSATFKHDSGHEIKILLKALPTIQVTAIKKLPLSSGGRVKLADGTTDGPLNSVQQAESDAKQTVMQRHRDASDAAEEAGDLTEASRQQKQVNANMGMHAKGGEVKMYADGTDQEPVSQNDPAPVASAAPQQAPSTGNTFDSPDAAVNMAGTQANVQAPQIDPKVPTMMNPNGTSNLPQAMNTEIQAAQDQAAVDQEKGKSLANLQAGYNEGLSQIATKRDQILSDRVSHVKEFNDWMTDPANQFDANHYMNTMSAPKKVTTAIGLFLGGLGGGIQGTGGNKALDFLNAQIDRDIAGQKERADRQKNIYGAYMKLYDNADVANDLTKATMLDVYNNKVQQIANQLATPQAQILAKQFAAKAAFEKSDALIKSIANTAVTRAGGTHVQGGIGPQAPAETPTKGKLDLNRAPHTKEQGISKDHLLAPDVEQRFNSADISGDPRFQKDRAEVEKQLEGAQLADKAIDTINEHFPELSKNISTYTGEPGPVNRAYENASGYIHRGGVNAESIPYVGHAIAAPLKAATDTQKNRDYDLHAATIKGAVIPALTHAGLAPTQAEDLVKTYLPDTQFEGPGDTPKMTEEKRKQFVEKIQNAVKKNALKRHGFLKKTE